MKNFKLIQNVKGYVNKKDVTNIDPEYLVPGSQNVIINDSEKISVRPGFELYGAASTTATPIISSFEWNTNTGTEVPLRKDSLTTLEFNYLGTWYTLKADHPTGSNLNFATWWDTSEKKDLLLFVDGTSNMHMWSGGITTYASSTANTITKEGTNTWAQDRFLLAGTRIVTIAGVDYTYTGGEGTTTLTGVTPDPTGAGIAVGAVAYQKVRTTATTPGSAVLNSLISVLKNQVYVGDLTRRDVYISKNTSYIDYTYTSPVRLPGEGALITLDSTPIAFEVQEEEMYISGSKDDWYLTQFTLSADLTKEDLKIQRLKSGPGRGAMSQASVGKAINSILYFSNDKSIDDLGRVENINTPESKPISDIIKLELDGYDITIKPHIKFHKNKTYVTFPSESKVLIFDHEKQLWNPPQILAIRRFAVIGGNLYGHSSLVKETYRIFVPGLYNDNGNAINAIAAFAYTNYGRPDWKKNFDEYYVEGYISSNTSLTAAIKYDFGGYGGIIEKTINGADDDFIVQTVTDGSLGKNPLGSNPLGSITDSPSNLPKFRTIFEIAKQDDWYEVQFLFSTNDVDRQWELLRFGPNATLSTEDNIDIKQ